MPRIEPIPAEKLTAAQRAWMDAGVESGAFHDRLPLRIMAYADHDAAPDDGDRHPNFPRHLLGGRLLELLRIRSAQIAGCAPCMTSRKVEGATEDVVACMLEPAADGPLSERERLALGYLQLMAGDHHLIDGETYRRLAQAFTTAEIVELGMTCGQMIGMHRFMHTLDIYGDAPPAVPYDPGQVGATWAALHRESAPAQA